MTGQAGQAKGAASEGCDGLLIRNVKIGRQ